ncbi:MAG: hypothetical protein ACXWUL_00905 [Caldimonas sp.]
MDRMYSVLAALAAACVVAACGGSGPDDVSAAGQAAGNAAPAASAPAAAPAASAPAAAPSASAPASAPETPPVVAITAPGTAIGPIATATIGASGGTLTSADGRLTLTVPAGALASAQAISIQATSGEAPNGGATVYRLLPDGLGFALPVGLGFRFDDADLGGSAAETLGVAFQDALGRWQPLADPQLDAAAKTLSAMTTHFTDYALFTGIRLRPAFAKLGVGKSRAINMDICYPMDDSGVTVIGCKINVTGSYEWAVNGIAGGSAAVGMIDGATLGARFEAPAVAPASNPVAVSAALTHKRFNKGFKTIAISSIWIEAHAPLAGTIISTQVTKLGEATITHTTSASVDFRFDVADNMHRPAAGTLVSRFDYVDPAAGCEYHVAFAGAIGAKDGHVTIRVDDGDTPRYVAAGKTLATHTGTTTCTGSRGPEPLAIENMPADWFPAPPEPHPLVAIPGAMVLRAKDDGSLREAFSWTPGKGGTDTTVQWRLLPR